MKSYIKENKWGCLVYTLLFIFLIVNSFLVEINFSQFCGFLLISLAGFLKFCFLNNKQKEVIALNE